MEVIKVFVLECLNRMEILLKDELILGILIIMVALLDVRSTA